MPSSTSLVTKVLAAQEDLLYGEGTAAQQRAGGTITVNKVRGFYPVNNLSELSTLDSLRFPKACVVSGALVSFYQYNGVVYEQLVLLPKGEATATALTAASVVGKEVVVITSSTPHTIIDLQGGTQYQVVRLIATNTNTTVANNANISLKGGADLNLLANTGVTLCYTGTIWAEV